MQICTLPQTLSYRSVFYKPDALPAAPPTASKHSTTRRCARRKEYCGVSIKPLLLCDIAENLVEMVVK